MIDRVLYNLNKRFSKDIMFLTINEQSNNLLTGVQVLDYNRYRLKAIVIEAKNDRQQKRASIKTGEKRVLVRHTDLSFQPTENMRIQIGSRLYQIVEVRDYFSEAYACDIVSIDGNVEEQNFIRFISETIGLSESAANVD